MNYAPVQQTPQARWVKEGDNHVLYDGSIKVARIGKRGWAVPKEDGGWLALDLETAKRAVSSDSSSWLPIHDGVEQASDGKSIRFQSRGRWIEVY